MGSVLSWKQLTAMLDKCTGMPLVTVLKRIDGSGLYCHDLQGLLLLKCCLLKKRSENYDATLVWIKTKSQGMNRNSKEK